jgi:long-chain acyl-CoA synthetase
VLEVTPRTLYQVLEETAARYGDAPALASAPADGAYLTYSWNEYRRAAEEIAAGLRALGVEKGQIVALDSETRLEFYLADMGILACGAIAAALYPSYPARSDSHHRGHRRRGGLRRGSADLPRAAPRPRQPLDSAHRPGRGRARLDDLRALGREALARDPELAAALRTDTQPSDPAVLYLTSGATGEPKMALVTHGHRLQHRHGPEGAADGAGGFDGRVSALGAHRAARGDGVSADALRHAGDFSESLMKLPQDIRKVRPTILLAPPRMWERIYSTICTELRKRPAVSRKAFYGGLALALAAARYRREGKPVPLRIRAPLALADRLLFHKVRARLGGRLRVACLRRRAAQQRTGRVL